MRIRTCIPAILLFYIKFCACGDDHLSADIKQNEAMCARFGMNAFFDPEMVVRAKWRIYYTWNLRLPFGCLDMTFKPVNPLIINRFYSDMYKHLETQPAWEAATLLVTMGYFNHQMLLFAEPGPAGKLAGVPNIAQRAIEMLPHPGGIPLLMFQLKLIRDAKWLIMMDCHIGAATLSYSGGTPTDLELKAAIADAGLGEGFSACMKAASKERNKEEKTITSTTMQELCRRVPQDQAGFFYRIVQILDNNYPMNWNQWEVQNLSYSDLFGTKISAKMEAKIRFALPTYELALAYSPSDPSLSKKKYRLIKRKLLEWPLGRALIYEPHSVVKRIHSKSYDRFMNTVKLLKSRLTYRDVVSTRINKKRFLSESRASSRSSKTQRRQSSAKAALVPNEAFRSHLVLEKVMELLSKQTQAFESIATHVRFKSDQGSSAFDKSVPVSTGSDKQLGTPSLNTEPRNNTSFLGRSSTVESKEAGLTDSTRSAEEIGVPSLDKGYKKNTTAFSPHIMEPEAKLIKADPYLFDQGRKCQRLNEEGWKNIGYDEIEKMFHATPVFTALKVNSDLATITPNSSLTLQLEKMDMTLGAVTYGLLLQKKAFREAIDKMDPEFRTEIQKHMLAPDSTYKKVSDGLLLYTCDRRSEIIQSRREIYKPVDEVLSDILIDIPPSDTHLFSEEKLSEAVKDEKGSLKFIPEKTYYNNKSKGKKKFPKMPKGRRKHRNKTKKPPILHFRTICSEYDNATSGLRQAMTIQASTKKSLSSDISSK